MPQFMHLLFGYEVYVYMNYSIVVFEQSACSYHIKLIWELSQSQISY